MKPLPLLLGCAPLLAACGLIVGKPQPPPPAPQAPAPRSGLERQNFDPAVRPQDDLYRAVSGRWLAQTTIPADKSNYGAFTVLADEAERQLRDIVESAAAQADQAPSSNAQKIGDFYASFMDEARIESLGLAPIAAELARVDAVEHRSELPLLMAELARTGVEVPLLPYVHVDARDPTQYAGDLYQGGLTLPERDYYLVDDAKFRKLRDDYRAYIVKLWTLAGFADAKAAARIIVEMEARIARVQWDKVRQRDPVQRYNRFATRELAGLVQTMDWRSYLDAVGYGALDSILISQPSFVADLGALMQNAPLDYWRTYLRWKVLDARAPLLGRELVAAHFDFHGRVLNGIQEDRPRWKRGVDAVEHALGEAIGQIYVERHFPPENKLRMEALVRNLIHAYGLAIDELDWMGPDTRRAAREKLAKFHYKIGYPDRWRDYTKLEVVAGDAMGNARRAAQFEYDRDIAKLGQPVDREEWGMTPQTVNAYYNPEKNEIVFPAAILQPPFFDAGADDAVNYGAIGAVIGHEITHGFDDKGSQYDGDGRLRVWWTADDRQRFDALGERLAAQYGAYEPVPGYHVDGRFTLGENIADLGGLNIAYRAYHLALGEGAAPVIDGLGGDQRFFMGWAQVWRRLYRNENLLKRLKTDPHSPNEYRCNGVVTNLPGFHDAFDVQPADRLYTAPDRRIRIW